MERVQLVPNMDVSEDSEITHTVEGLGDRIADLAAL